jgi:hypothetical protein
VTASYSQATRSPLLAQVTIGARNRVTRVRAGDVGVDDGDRTRDRQVHNLELYRLSYVHHRFRPLPERRQKGYHLGRRQSHGAPGRIRTCDLKIRSLLLYPAELRAPGSIGTAPHRGATLRRRIGAGDGSRTRDPQLGRLMLYQLSYSRPHPERWSGRADSNRRPPAPKAGALPDCATSRRPKYTIGVLLLEVGEHDALTLVQRAPLKIVLLLDLIDDTPRVAIVTVVGESDRP